MTTKLTLSINSDILEKAKKFLRSENQSLSSLVEDYFRVLINTKQTRGEETPIVSQLTGIAKTPYRDAKKTIVDYLQEKYR